MLNFSGGLRLVDKQVEIGKNTGVVQVSIDSIQQSGRIINAQGLDLINFGSCSYLGLETDKTLKNAGIQAINNFGTQYSSSRAYASLGLYEELENRLKELFGKPTILATSTSMGHFSAIPVLVGKNDAIILDYQVHASVQTAVKLVQANGTYITTVPHNDMEALDLKVKELSLEYESIWYMCDGIYSMYGDVAPVKEIEDLLEKHPKMHLYIDDAHGVSWYGKNGRGYVLEHMDFHPRMVLTASAAKSFGSCGGLIVLPNADVKRMIRNCGGTLMFSGPLQPAVLGALNASVKLHLSKDINSYQKELKSNIDHFIKVAKELELPMANEESTPIFYIGAGNLQIGLSIIRKAMNLGYYMNIANFPAVPRDKTGLRITITRHQTKEDISNFLRLTADLLKETLKENNFCYSRIFKAFEIPLPKQFDLVEKRL